ncbi:uncharacterized protein LOC133180037 [Saccostrea echinata]|uniref:uncharacterized protein LOC133180037 n=1 Tax=Saccostrea echinata TaxID=191078 RepID=UPI002A8255ED|nr:uncharacterized protein LOC133180037 [Saccostrea echinata]
MARKSLHQELEVTEFIENTSTTESIPQCPSTCQTSDIMTDKCFQVKPQEASMSTQTERNINIELEVRIENSMLKNKVKLLQNEVDHLKTSSSLKIPSKPKTSVETSSEFTFDNIMKDEEKFKYFTGLTISQFMCLWEYLGPSRNKLVYWNSDCEYPDRSSIKRPGPKHKLEPKNELSMTLMRLRHGFVVEDLSYRLNDSTSMVSRIILTWVQFLYKRFLPLRSKMFPSRSHLSKFAPKSFKKYKNIRCIIDCTEVLVQQPRDFGKQGNCYSSYKGHI